MGWRTVADVRDHSAATGSTYTVALMLAERAPDETRIARPGINRLADDARCNKRTAQRALRWLVNSEEIEVVAFEEGGRGKATEYRILVGLKGRQNVTLSEATERVTSQAQKGVADVTPTGEEPEPSVVGDQRSPTTSGPAIEETPTRFCRFLTEAGGGDPDEKRYSAKQLADATFLLERRDRELLKSVVEWAHTRTYWAPKVVTSTMLRRWWDQLFADYRAARRQGNGNGVQADRSDVPEIPGVHPGVVASTVFMLKGAGEPITEERVRERLRRSGHLKAAA